MKIGIFELHWDRLPEDDAEPGAIQLCRDIKRKDYISFKWGMEGSVGG